MNSFVYALFTREMTTSVNKMGPTTMSFGPWFSGFVKLGTTPGGGGKAGSWRIAGSCRAEFGICWVMAACSIIQDFSEGR